MKKLKALVTRCGAYGDMIMITPVLRKLYEDGYDVYVHTGQRGLDILKHNPYVKEFIKYEKEGVENPKIQDDWKAVEDKIKPDWHKNFSESIEVNLALHPRSPRYIYTKEERRLLCDINYYDETAKWAELDLKVDGKILPELYFSDEEIKEAKKLINYKEDEFTILWCMSGSGANKAYPWSDYVMGEVLKDYPEIRIVTIGDEKCQIIETISDKRILNLSGKINMRQSLALTRLSSLVIAPDTGILHGSGSSSVAKIGILGHTSIENVTKYFENDYSLEADESLSQCSPCFRLIYDHKIQCPVDPLTGAAWCMSHGQPAQRLSDQIRKVINELRNTKEIVRSDNKERMSCLL